MSQTTIKSNYHTPNGDEFDLREVFNTFLHYKWSILLITLLTLAVAASTLYFKPNIYSASAMIEVKSGGSHSSMPEGDFLGGALSGFGSANVDKDIELLKTFHVNNIVIDKINFHTRYFVDSKLKQVEIYDNVPIEVKNISIIDEDILGYKIKVLPEKSGYHLQVLNTFKRKLLHSLFDKKIIELDNQKLYPYNKTIETDYFKLILEKKENIDNPVYFVLMTDNRSIYEGLKGSLSITQINLNAPLIEIAFTDTIPIRATAYVDELAKSFILQSIAEKSKGNNRIIDFINRQLNEIKIKLDISEEKLEKYRITHQAIEPSLQARTYISELSKIDIERSQNEPKDPLQFLHSPL